MTQTSLALRSDRAVAARQPTTPDPTRAALARRPAPRLDLTSANKAIIRPARSVIYRSRPPRTGGGLSLSGVLLLVACVAVVLAGVSVYAGRSGQAQLVCGVTAVLLLAFLIERSRERRT